ncbi:tetratricopeptide repeat protein [Leucothrix sargassi]|nr:tetratricopeptide repeat protein [Leucothrix sargassi]
MDTTTPVTKHRAQGLMIGLASLTLASAIGAVAYTIISKQADKEEPEAAPQSQATLRSFSLNDLKSIEQQLSASFLSTDRLSKTEDVQAIRNTLNNLHSRQNPLATETLELLDEGQLMGAIATLSTLALDTEDKRDAAKIWVDIGNLENLQSQEKAIKAYQKAVTLDADNINAWNRIGHLERQNNNFDLAEIAYTNVTRLSTKGTLNQARSWTNFGLLYQTQNKTTEAIEAFENALETNTALENEAGIASNSENLAGLYRAQGVFDKAEAHYQQVLKIYQKTEQTLKQVEIHAALGSLYQSQQNPELALVAYEKALSLNTGNEDTRFSASLYSNMGILAQQNNELEKAEGYFKQSLAIFEKLDQKQGIANQYSNLAILARNRKQFDVSESLHLQAIELYTQQNNASAITTQHTNLGFLYTAWNKPQSACEYWTKSLEGLSGEQNTARRARISAIVEKDCTTEVSAPQNIEVSTE